MGKFVIGVRINEAEESGNTGGQCWKVIESQEKIMAGGENVYV